MNIMKYIAIILALFVWTGNSIAQEIDGYGNEETFDSKEIKLNDNCTIHLKEISQSEYIAKAEKSYPQNEPYIAITDINKAVKMLGKRFKIIELKEDWIQYKYEITFKDGTKKRLDDDDYYFVAYFPQLKILYFRGGHESDQPFDLNNSNYIDDRWIDFPYRIKTGNPEFHSVSPDKQLRINGLHDGQDCLMRFLEKWNKRKKTYEFIGWLWGENHIFDICYAENFLWTSNNNAIFTKSTDKFYEIEVIAK